MIGVKVTAMLGGGTQMHGFCQGPSADGPNILHKTKN